MCIYGTSSSRRPKGAALVIAMLVMAVLLLAGTTFMTISSTESQIALNERASGQAFRLAEAGLGRAIAALNGNAAYAGESGTLLAGGSFDVVVASAASQICPSGDSKDVTVTGYVTVRGGQATTQIRATLDRSSYPFRYGLFADEYLYLLSFASANATDGYDSALGSYSASSAVPAGHLGANQGVLLWNTTVRGNVRSADYLYRYQSNVIDGGISTNVAAKETLPNITPPVTPSSGLSVSAGATFNLAAAGSPYYYTTMTFGDGARLTTSGGRVTVYAAGNVTLGYNVTLGTVDSSDLTLITKSDKGVGSSSAFTAGPGFKLYGAMYGRDTYVKMDDNGALYGSMVVRDIRGSWSDPWNQKALAVHYDVAMANRSVCHTGSYRVRKGSWREVLPST